MDLLHGRYRDDVAIPCGPAPMRTPRQSTDVAAQRHRQHRHTARSVVPEVVAPTDEFEHPIGADRHGSTGVFDWGRHRVGQLWQHLATWLSDVIAGSREDHGDADVDISR